ncbi:hypothetical protein OXPF_30870 [Oxobacter pfennigii]|uniref:Uncharacterized protein n=1 Tax=Oxobacter pfennigii TaxID=36849 RepID=A0A0P8Y9S1_9CLOT|nr:hypothetical protein [Oxobacter pfennigii]KPU43645.1 hypothetical protein OXPF_30870 [Oxobacter pfennigii]
MKKINSRVPIAVLISVMLIFLNISIIRYVREITGNNIKSVMGGTIIKEGLFGLEVFDGADSKKEDDYIQRFFRPSKEKVMDKKYFFNKEGAELPKVFQASNDVVRAYFDIISDAANMGSKKGGMGSIGYGTAPYPEAYKLLSEDKKKAMTYESFLKSFESIGHINLLKMAEGPSVKSENSISPRYFVEIETIEGSDTLGKTYFAYYYGYITLNQDGNNGWRIHSIELIPEDFLSHAYHGWHHDANSIVKFIYGDKLNIVDKVLNMENDGYFSNIIAKGKDGKQYRFTFIRITNGADIPFRQFVMDEGKWKDVEINF